MPAPVAAAIITGAAGLGATAMASHASGSSAKRASDIESNYNNRALDAAREERDYQRQQDAAAIARQIEQRDYTRAQANSYRDRLAPFRTAGVHSINRLDASLAGNMAASVPTNGPVGGALVPMKAPNGQIKSIPAHLVDMAMQKGAVRV